MITRYDYSLGHRTKEAAEADLDDAFSTGDVSEGERPRIEAYKTVNGARRFKITLEG